MPASQVIAPDELFPAVQAAEVAATGIQDTLNAASGSGFDNRNNAANLVPYSAPAAGGGTTVGDTAKKPKKANSNKAGFQTSGLQMPDFSSLGRKPTESNTRAFSGDDTDYTGLANMAPEVDVGTETVQGQLAALFENPDANPLWEYAKGIASQYANTRGLVNSDIAAEAGAQAVFAQAMPIAQQDANTFAARAQQEAQFWQNAGLQAQAATIESGLMAQSHMEQLVELDRQGDINSRLQLEQFGYNKALSAQDNMHKMQQLALQGDINAELALQQFGFDTALMKQDHGYRVNLMQIELSNALRIGEQNNSNALSQLDRQNRNTMQQIAAQQVNTLQQIAANGAQDRQNIAAQGSQNRQTVAAQGDENRQTDAANNAARLDQIAASGAAQQAADAANNLARLDQIAAQGDLDAARQASDEAARLDQIAAQGQLDADRQASDEAARLEQDRLRDELQREADDDRFTRDLQQNYLNAGERATATFINTANAIWQNEGLTAAQQANAITVARNEYVRQLDFLTAQYSASPYWDSNWTISPVSTPGGTPNPAIQPYQPPPPGPVPTIGPTNDYGEDFESGGQNNGTFNVERQGSTAGTTAARTVSNVIEPKTNVNVAPIQSVPSVTLQAPPQASAPLIGGRRTGAPRITARTDR